MIELNSTTFQELLPSGDRVEIGDKDSPDFKPHIKLNRWNGECFIKVGLPTPRKIAPILEGTKVKWIDKDIEADFYPLEPRTVEGFTQNELGGFEFEVILKKKPKSNKIILNIETQGLKFYYQPELTPDEIADGCSRPENVVGSYAVYHATRTNMHASKADAEKYKCGKAVHIYRPKIIDASGKWIWADLKIDEVAGTLTTTIDQDFLDNAIYPVSIDPDFGYTTIGSSDLLLSADRLRKTNKAYAGSAGTGNSMSIACHSDSIGSHVKLALYKNSDGSLVGQTTEITRTGDTWDSANFVSEPTLEAVDYQLVYLQNEVQTFYYDTAELGYNYAARTYEDGFPNSGISWSTSSYKAEWSIYCTYTPAAPPVGGGAQNIVMGAGARVVAGGGAQTIMIGFPSS